MANGTLKVQNIETSSGSGTITLGQSGETVVFGSGVTTKFNQPAFEAYASSTITYTDSTNFKIGYDTEVFDTDSDYNTTDDRFTPSVAGKYFVYASACFSGTITNGIEYLQHSIYKNGSQYRYTVFDPNNSYTPNVFNLDVQAIIDMNGSTDYVETFGYGIVSGGTIRVSSSVKSSFFGAYRIGVE